MKRTTLLYKIKKLDIRPEEYGPEPPGLDARSRLRRIPARRSFRRSTLPDPRASAYHPPPWSPN